MTMLGVVFLFYLDRFGESYVGELKQHSLLQWTVSEKEYSNKPSYKFTTELEDIAVDQQQSLGSGRWNNIPLQLEVQKDGLVIVTGDGELLGYLPKTTGNTVIRLLNDGVNVQCKIGEANYTEGVLNVTVVLKWK